MNPDTDQPQPEIAPEPQVIETSPPAPQPSTPKPSRHGSIEGLTEPGEVLVFKVKKHLFGLVVMYLQALVGYALVAGLLLYTVPNAVGADRVQSVTQLIQVGLVMVGAILFLILLVVTYVYRQNQLQLTDRNITQVIRNGLFDRQVSQLSLNNVEDVTSEKHGIFPMLFNFGQVRVETAGEQNNFHFMYCPYPDHYAQQILDTRAKCRSNSPPH